MIESYTLYKDKLKDEYYETFDKIELYCVAQNMDYNSQQEFLMELTDVFLTAQGEGKAVSQIVGNSLERFCKNFCSGIGLKSHLLEFADVLKRLGWIVLVFCFIDLIRSSRPFWEIKSNGMPLLLGTILGILISSILGIVFKRLMFRWKKVSMKLYYVVLFISTICFVSLSVLLSEKYSLTVYNWIVIMIAGVYLLIYYIARRLFFNKPRENREKIKPSDLVIEQMPESLMMSYVKKNDRRLKRGKEPMTPEEYTQKIRKDNNMERLLNRGIWLIYLAIVSGITIIVSFDSTVMDTIIFACLCGGIWFSLYYFLVVRLSMKAANYRKQILDECEEQDITILEYCKAEKK